MNSPATFRRGLAPVAVAILALGIGAPSDVRAQSPIPDGDWLSAAYADALVSARSPVAAAQASDPVGLSVRTENGVTRLAVTSFHETMRWRLVGQEPGKNGGARMVLAEDEGAPDAEARRRSFDYAIKDEKGATTLTTTLTFSGEGSARYRRLPGTIADWTAEVMLAGAYRDERGHPWRFGVDQWARTPEGSYRYAVALDPSEAGCSYFETPDVSQPGGKRRIGFAWQGAALQLFRVVYEPDRAPIDCAAKPFVVLRRDEPAPSRTDAPAGAGTAKPSCRMSELPIAPRSAGDWAHMESTSTSFTLRHQNPRGTPNPSIFTEPVTLVRRDGSSCEFDPTNYSRLWVSRDESTIAVVASSGSSSDLMLFDARTCKVRDQLAVYGDGVTIDGDLVRHPGDCEMADSVRGTCEPASFWRLDAACRPVRLPEESAAWTRERFGVAFSKSSEVERPFTPGARWLGLRRDK